MTNLAQLTRLYLSLFFFSYLVNLSGLWEFLEAITTEDFFIIIIWETIIITGTKKKLNKIGQRVNESI